MWGQRVQLCGVFQNKVKSSSALSRTMLIKLSHITEYFRFNFCAIQKLLEGKFCTAQNCSESSSALSRIVLRQISLSRTVQSQVLHSQNCVELKFCAVQNYAKSNSALSRTVQSKFCTVQNYAKSNSALSRTMPSQILHCRELCQVKTNSTLSGIVPRKIALCLVKFCTVRTV